RHAGVVGLAADGVGIAEQDRLGHAIVGEDPGGLEDTGVLALRKHDPLRFLLGATREAAHHLAGAPEAGVELGTILVHVDDSSRPSAASAGVAAISIASLIFLARTSSAPRKMKGKPSTLLTWLG